MKKLSFLFVFIILLFIYKSSINSINKNIFSNEFLKKSIYRSKNLFLESKNFSELDKTKFKSCLPILLKKIPLKSTVVIGHAYGRSKGLNLNRNSFISKNIDKFLEKNKNQLNAVIFTGDIFAIPTLTKWEKLYNKYEDYFNIYIAPGNHEISNLENKKIFESYIQNKQNINYPILINESQFNIILDDSNYKQDLENYKIRFSKFQNYKDIIIMQHHILVDELSEYGGTSNYIFTKEKISEIFSKIENVTFIYGNGGMYFDLPRIACYMHKNVNHILNGVGDFKEDNIIVLSKGKIYRYQINK